MHKAEAFIQFSNLLPPNEQQIKLGRLSQIYIEEFVLYHYMQEYLTLINAS